MNTHIANQMQACSRVADTQKKFGRLHASLEMATQTRRAASWASWTREASASFVVDVGEVGFHSARGYEKPCSDVLIG